MSKYDFWSWICFGFPVAMANCHRHSTYLIHWVTVSLVSKSHYVSEVTIFNIEIKKNWGATLMLKYKTYTVLFMNNRSSKYRFVGSNPECTCCGFLISECTVHRYKWQTGGDTCSVCPENSQTRVTGSVECDCIDGFFRSQADSRSMPCTSTLSLVVLLYTGPSLS